MGGALPRRTALGLLAVLLVLAALLAALQTVSPAVRGQSPGNDSYAIIFPNIEVGNLSDLNLTLCWLGTIYDPANGYMYLAMGNITALGPNNSVVSVLASPGWDIGTLLYDPYNHYVYALNWLNGTLVAIAPNNSVVSNVNVGLPEQSIAYADMAYDPANHYIYIGIYNNSERGSLVIVAPNNTVVANVHLGNWSGGGPWGVPEFAYDPANGYMYVAAPSGITLAVTPNDTIVNMSFPVSLPIPFTGLPGGPTVMAYDPANGYMYAVVYDNYLVAIAPNNTVVATITAGPVNVSSARIRIHSLAYDPANGYMYALSSLGYLLAIAPNNTVVANISLAAVHLVYLPYPYESTILAPIIPYIISYDPATQDMLVVFQGVNYNKLVVMAVNPDNQVVANLSVSLPVPSTLNITWLVPSSMIYDPTNQEVYLPLMFPGSYVNCLLALIVTTTSPITTIQTTTTTTTTVARTATTTSTTATAQITSTATSTSTTPMSSTGTMMPTQTTSTATLTTSTTQTVSSTTPVISSTMTSIVSSTPSTTSVTPSGLHINTLAVVGIVVVIVVVVAVVLIRRK